MGRKFSRIVSFLLNAIGILIYFSLAVAEPILFLVAGAVIIISFFLKGQMKPNHEAITENVVSRQLFEFKCPNCGASLQPSGRSEFIKCEYCDTTSRIPEFPADVNHVVLNTADYFTGPGMKKGQRHMAINGARRNRFPWIRTVLGLAAVAAIVHIGCTSDSVQPVIQAEQLQVEYGTILQTSEMASISDDRDQDPELIAKSVSPSGAEISDEGSSVLFDEVGTYIVELSGSDASNNTTTATVKVLVVDTTPPVFGDSCYTEAEYGQELRLEENGNSQSAIGVNASDQSAFSLMIDSVSQDGKSLSDGEYEQTGDALIFYQPGTYQVGVRAIDAYHNEAAQVEEVVVFDKTKPVLTGLGQSIELSDVETDHDYINGVRSQDEIDGDLTDEVKIDDSEVLYGTPGSYKVFYSITDHSGNQQKAEVPVLVKDTTAPQLELVQTVFTLAAGSAKPDYRSYISASDTFDGDLKARVLIDDSKVDYSTPGTYEVICSAADSAGNTVTKTASVTIEKPYEPIPEPEPEVVERSIGSGGGEIVYITQTGEKYHRAGCRYLKESCIEISMSDALAQGYEPCKVCDP